MFSSATKGLKTKNSKSSSKGGGGFVSSLKRAPLDANLSEESSDESSGKINDAEDDFEISDDILASIDLTPCVQSGSSTIVNNGASTTEKKATTKSAKAKKLKKSKLC